MYFWYKRLIVVKAFMIVPLLIYVTVYSYTENDKTESDKTNNMRLICLCAYLFPDARLHPYPPTRCGIGLQQEEACRCGYRHEAAETKVHLWS